MLISLFPTPSGHFQFLGSAGQNPNLILTLCHKYKYRMPIELVSDKKGKVAEAKK